MKQARQQSINQVNEGQHIQHEAKDSLRLNKFISDTGHCSRREADRLIEAGRVTVDGELASVGLRVTSGQTVAIDGNPVTLKTEKVYIALHKPKGVTSTTDQAIPGNLTDFMNYPEMIFPIGRLDKDSTGLILLTNDGDIVNKILREENGHDKEYQVMVDKKIDSEFVKNMETGVMIYNPVADKRQITLPTKIEPIGNRSFNLTLKQGLNRQIRRMCQELGYQVVTLKRKRIMNVQLGNLAEGQWRYLTKEELISINEAINRI
ncbi:pseudouridine synthase [Vagococcus sp. BWB3-3]|uniref:Pseudouridine synthase n=1 Tax=Vagococcus allomyrinae TaxID=2794353 RepID=A0A940SVB2_9ENTE|nr:pseudouridine synthase [Vagococcus allomyrinae]MBP1041669.1 pseudouridine synthase [Vagococcus allomyrinae]